MELKTLQEDPLGILESTKPVVEQARHVSINFERLRDAAKKIEVRFAQGLDTQEMGFGVTDNIEDDVQLVFIEDVVNFCFWAGKNEPKWQVEFPKGTFTNGGWYSLKTCFERGVHEGVPILDAHYLATVTGQDVAHFFRGANGTIIPLLQERVQNLQEAGRVLLEKFDGKFINAVEQAGYDAICLAQIIIDNFSSYQDISLWNGKEVRFLKRAQICPNDLQYIFRGRGKAMSSLDKLTAFADYKLPQILRFYGVFEYSGELANKVDRYVELPHDSQEEIEIRAATVWATELLRQQVPKLTAADVDNTIWLLSQGMQGETKPYHRTRTIFY